MKILNVIIFILCLALLSCNGFSNKKTPLYKIPETSKNILAPVLQNQFNSGVDFAAAGNLIADWNLEMNFDDSIRFRAQNGLNFTIPSVRPEIKSDSSQIFTSSITLGKVVIIIGSGVCNNVQNKEAALARQCTVIVGEVTYSGCGQFLFDTQLDGKWNLQQYKADKISEAGFKNGIPFLKFDLVNNKLSGFDGCNNLIGMAEAQGKRIKFSDVAVTKKYCTENLLQNPFSILNQQLVGYKILNDLLYLYLIDDSVIILKKSN